MSCGCDNPECRFKDPNYGRVFPLKPEDTFDPVTKPKHYNSHPSGVEAITITEHMSFCIGNAIKYLWRCDHKNGIEDLKKARWYIDREIQRREKINGKPSSD